MERQADRTAEKNRRPDVNMYLALFTRPSDWREEQRRDDSCEPLKHEQADKQLVGAAEDSGAHALTTWRIS